MNHISRFQLTLGQALPASLLLHGLVVGVVWGVMHGSPSSPSRRPLDLQLLGMLSEHQVEQQARARPSPAAPRPQAPTPRHEDAPRKVLASAHASPSPVLVAADKPEPEAPPQATPTPPAPSALEPALEDRQQQTIQPRESEADALRRYLLGLRKVIQRHLQYPAEAKAAGLVGAPVVHFTLTEQGEILPGSLGIRQSSGYPLLDEQALRAAQASAPFEQPPRRIEVAMAIAFEQAK